MSWPFIIHEFAATTAVSDEYRVSISLQSSLADALTENQVAAIYTYFDGKLK
jgi:hypothetical protein